MAAAAAVTRSQSAAVRATPVAWPQGGEFTLAWIRNFEETVNYASRNLPAEALQEIIPPAVADDIFNAATKCMQKEPNLLQLQPDASKGEKVIIVGDVHGQLHDVLRLLETIGPPDSQTYLVFNGDYVDRGAWGFETYLLLLAYKLYMPKRVYLLRGNHETKFCAACYGFEQEVMLKYGSSFRNLYRRILMCFSAHPLAAVIADITYVAHGGLFRSPACVTHRRKGSRGFLSAFSRSKAPQPLRLGVLGDLAGLRRSVLDPSGHGANVLPADILWSDPLPEPGLAHNNVRGIGLVFGPDQTQEFLEKNGLKLVVRSHEGPDARDKRPMMKGIDGGYTIDHEVAAGKLMTVFSAPDYPQFQMGLRRPPNRGAYLVLRPSKYSEPEFFEFEAVLPRPKVKAYYDYETCQDSDEELDIQSESSATLGGSDGGSEGES